MTLAIHTVFVLRENILFIEEWIDYHILIGFDKFYLYDNSNSLGCDGSTPEVNKYNYDFKNITKHIPDYKLETLLANLLEKFGDKIVYVEWAPMDYAGNICYGQKESIVDYICKYSDKYGWTAFIDMDEFIYCKISLRDVIEKCAADKIGDIVLLQKKFDDRFNNLDRPVTEIVNCIEGIDTTYWAPKHIIRNCGIDINTTSDWNIHTLPIPHHGFYKGDLQNLRFNHYNVNECQLEWMKHFYREPIGFKLNAQCYDLLDRYTALKSRRPVVWRQDP